MKKQADSKPAEHVCRRPRSNHISLNTEMTILLVCRWLGVSVLLQLRPLCRSMDGDEPHRSQLTASITVSSLFTNVP